MTQNKIVLKIGGSILYDNTLNVNFKILEKVKIWYESNKDNYEKIAMVTGGGGLSRDLQKKIAGSIVGQEYLHNIAMYITQTNATVVHGYLGDMSIYIPKKLGDACEFLLDNGKTLISGGLKVGWSTDMDAAVFADLLDVDIVYKVSNIDYIYESDPKQNPSAKSFKDLSWKEYFKLFGIVEGDGHQANKSIPIDATCAQFCAKKGISFFVCGGENLEKKDRLEDVLFQGTLVHP